jgi:hypothetical protein
VSVPDLQVQITGTQPTLSAGIAAGGVSGSAVTIVPKDLIDRLIVILIRMTRYSTVDGGDITKRNDEALGNPLLAFYDEKL